MSLLSDAKLKVAKFLVNMGRFDTIMNGDANTDVPIDSGTVPTIRKLFQYIIQNVVGVKILGSVNTVANLPTTGNSIGDIYIVITAGANNAANDGYVWTGATNGWRNIGQIRGPKGDTGATGPQGPYGAPADTITQSNQNDSDRSSVGTTGVALPYKLNPAERDKDGYYNINNWIAKADRVNSSLGMYATNYDAAPAIRSAFDSGEDISFPAGNYLCNSGNAIAKKEGQKFKGSGGRNKSRILLRENFDLNSGNLFKLNHQCEIEDLDFHCKQYDNIATGNFPETRNGTVYQNSTNADLTRNTIIKYPWLIDVNGKSRARIKRIRMQQAYLGILGLNNCGGLDTDQLELGVLNTAFLVDGALDFVSCRGTHFWPFGFSQRSDLMSVLRDGTTLGFDLGQCESYDFQGVKTFGSIIRLRASVVTSGGFAFGTMAGVSLDGNSAWMEVLAGRALVVGLYSTKDGNGQYGIIARGGKTIISGADFDHNSDVAVIYCNGGDMHVSSSRVRQYNPNGRSALVDSGNLILTGNNFEPINTAQTRNVPIIQQANSGSTLRAVGNSIVQKRSDQTGEGLNMNYNGPGCVAGFNDFGGWAVNFANNGGKVSNNI